MNVNREPYKIEYYDSYALIHLKYKDQFLPVKVDNEDIPNILSFPKTLYIHLATNGQLYVQGHLPKIKGQFKTIYLHRMILREPDSKMHVDHINNDALDNRKCNLRVVSRSVNLQNARIYKESLEVPGVIWSKRERRWKGRVKVEGKYVHVGTFKDKSEAENAVRKARAILLPHSIEAMAVNGT